MWWKHPGRYFRKTLCRLADIVSTHSKQECNFSDNFQGQWKNSSLDCILCGKFPNFSLLLQNICLHCKDVSLPKAPSDWLMDS